MNDLISRQALLRDIEKYHLSDGMFQHWVEVQPSVDIDLSGFSDRLWKTAYERGKVEAVRHGHWIIPRFGANAKCSVCGYYFNDAYDMENEDNYCRHCGARMDGE